MLELVLTRVTKPAQAAIRYNDTKVIFCMQNKETMPVMIRRLLSGEKTGTILP